MTRKELKNLARKIINQENILASSHSTEKEKAQAEQNIKLLCTQCKNLDEMQQVDDMILTLRYGS